MFHLNTQHTWPSHPCSSVPKWSIRTWTQWIEKWNTSQWQARPMFYDRGWTLDIPQQELNPFLFCLFTSVNSEEPPTWLCVLQEELECHFAVVKTVTLWLLMCFRSWSISATWSCFQGKEPEGHKTMSFAAKIGEILKSWTIAMAKEIL